MSVGLDPTSLRLHATNNHGKVWATGSWIWQLLKSQFGGIPAQSNPTAQLPATTTKSTIIPIIIIVGSQL